MKGGEGEGGNSIDEIDFGFGSDTTMELLVSKQCFSIDNRLDWSEIKSMELLSYLHNAPKWSR